MHLEITIKNYRCFSDSEPAQFTVRNGLTSFVGANNAGKSTLLRFFYEFRNLFAHFYTSEIYQMLNGHKRDFQPPNSVKDINQLFYYGNTRDMVIDFNFRDFPQPEGFPSVPLLKRIIVTIPRGTNTFSAEGYISERPILAKPDGQSGTHLIIEGKPIADLSEMEKAFAVLQDTQYLGSFRNAINLGSAEDYYDIKVGQAFITDWDRFKSGDVLLHRQQALGVEREIRRIFGYKELQIHPTPDNQTLIVTTDRGSFQLDELGSGLAQFIIVLANVAIRRPAYVLLDEPELSLHPSLQLDFLTTLASYTTEGLIFATHSLGLARAASERIYSLIRLEDGNSQVRIYEDTPRLTQFLGELSYSSYRELGFNKVLLVEGPTEIKTIQQFLRLYGKEHQVLILSLGGADFINSDRELELEEVKRITKNISVLVDSERSSESEPLSPNRQAFVDICERLKFDRHVLEKRATENYFTSAAIQAVKGEKYQALEPYQLLKEAPIGWAKSDNWRIAREMSREDLDGNDLGQFLATL